MSKSIPYLHVINVKLLLFILVSVSFFSCRKEFADYLKSEKNEHEWAEDYYLNVLTPTKGNAIKLKGRTSGVDDAYVKSRTENKIHPLWEKASSGQNRLYQFVEVPIRYSVKVVPMLSISQGKSSGEPVLDQSTFKASFDRLVIYKRNDGRINQRIISFIPDKAYLQRHNGDISHNKINKLDRDFDGYLVYKRWDGKYLFILRIENGNVSKKYESHKVKTYRSASKSISTKAEICEWVDVYEWFQDCYFDTDDPSVILWCDPPYPEYAWSEEYCYDDGSEGVDCSDPTYFNTAECEDDDDGEHEEEDPEPDYRCAGKALVVWTARHPQIYAASDALVATTSSSNNPNGYEYGTSIHTSNNYATGSLIPSPITSSGGQGSWNAPPFTWDATNGYTVGELHTHPGGTAPSPSDVMSMAHDLASVPTSDQAFYKENVSRTIVTQWGNYVVKVSDWAGFMAEYNTFNSTPLSTYNSNYLSLPDNGAGSRFLQKFGDFLTLYKADPNSIDYKPLTLNENNAVTVVDCP